MNILRTQDGEVLYVDDGMLGILRKQTASHRKLEKLEAQGKIFQRVIKNLQDQLEEIETVTCE